MNTSSDLKKDAERFLRNIGSSGKAQTEVVLERNQESTVNWADRKPNLRSVSIDDGVCVRVLENGHQGIITAKAVGPERAATLAAKALDVARLSPADPHRRFATPAPHYSMDIATDVAVLQTPIEETQEKLSHIETVLLKSDVRLKKIVKMSYSEGKESFCIANTQKVSLATETSQFTFAVEILAEQGGHTEVGWDFQMTRFKKDLDVEKIANAVAFHTLRSLGGKPISSGSYAIVVHPRVGTQLLSLVTDALSAEAVQRGRSFWRSGSNSTVAAPAVTFVDDPLLFNGVASSPFDEEGVPHESLNVVEGGVLKDYFYDLRSSARAGRESNGRGSKASLGSLPKPGPTNFYMKPGDKTQDQLLSVQSRVFLLEDVMGLHMADPITGEFSLGASGSLYENGRFSKPVRGVTVAATIGDMMKKVVLVGNDLTWHGSFGCPSFLVDQMTIAGV